MTLVAGLHRVSWRCSLGVSAAVFTTIFSSQLRHINRRHVWAGHLLDAARSAAARRHTCLSTASARP